MERVQQQDGALVRFERRLGQQPPRRYLLHSAEGLHSIQVLRRCDVEHELQSAAERGFVCIESGLEQQQPMRRHLLEKSNCVRISMGCTVLLFMCLVVRVHVHQDCESTVLPSTRALARR